MKGFKDFVMRGNLIEMAVAFIMAAAFADVVKSFTAVIMDLIGKLLPLDPGTAFSSVAIGGISIGAFLTALFSFLIIAFVLYFAVVTPYEKVKQLRGIEDAKAKSEAELLTEIRDLLAGR